MSVTYLIVSSVAFQGVWFLCVLAMSPWNFLAAAILVATHIYMVENRTRALTVVIVATILGPSVDAIQAYFGFLTFSNLESGLIPLWLIALWAGFATLFTGSLEWLTTKPKLAVVLGLVFGPVSYLSAAYLGALEVSAMGVVSLALVWAALMYLFCRLAARSSSEASLSKNLASS